MNKINNRYIFIDLFHFDLSIRYFLQYSVISLAILPSMSLLAYRYFLALQSRIPSIIEAWLSASEITASSGPTICSNKPAFASKQLAYNIVSSLSWNLEIFSSNSYEFCNKIMIMILKVIWWLIKMVVKIVINHKNIWYRAIICRANAFALKKYLLKGRTFTAIAKS